MGINSLVNSTAAQEVKLTAGSTIANGDLLVSLQSSVVVPAVAGLTVAQNNITTLNTAITPYSQLTTTYYGGAQNYNTGAQIAQLSTNNFVYVYNGNGTNNSTQNINISYKTANNTLLYATQTITDASATSNTIRVRKIGTTGFVVAWCAGTTLKFAIYNNDSTVVLSTTTVATLATTGAYNVYDVNVTASNDIVFSYYKAGGACSFTRYNSSGTIQGAEVTVEASATPNTIKVLPIAAGGFWIYYQRTATTAAWKFARYDSTGTLQGALTTVATSSVLYYYGQFDNIAIELSGGNVVLLSLNASNVPQYNVYSSTGTVVKSTTVIESGGTTYVSNNYVPGICLTGTGFTLSTIGSSTGINFYVYDSSGNPTQTRKTTGTDITYLQQRSTFTNNGIQLFNLGNAGYAALVSCTTIPSCCVYYQNIYLIVFDSTGTSTATALNLYFASSTTYFTNNVYSIVTPDGSVAATVAGATSTLANISAVFNGTYAVQKRSIIGVAQEAITTNATGRVATAGTYNINQAFSGSGAFNNNAATVVGTKGAVINSNAVINGLI